MKKNIHYFSLLYGVDSIILFKEASYKKKKKSSSISCRLADFRLIISLFLFIHSSVPKSCIVFIHFILFMYLLTLTFFCRLGMFYILPL